ncbi:MAG: MMPL family transporter, partial [Solirubrobacteraceae bacterium]
MQLSRIFERIVGAAIARPLAIGTAVAALALAGGLLALGLRPNAGTDTLVSRGSQTFRATSDYHRHFGDDAVLVLVRGDLPNLVLTSDIERLLGLEGCIAGNLPPGQQPLGGPDSPCAMFARAKPKLVRVVYGPGTFLNEAVRQIQEQFGAQQRDEAAREQRATIAARTLAAAQGRSRAEQDRVANEARQLVRAQFLRSALQLALAYGIQSLPRLNDPEFVTTIVFDPSRGANVPKARFAYLFPNKRSALVQVRLRPGLSTARRRAAIDLIEQATRMPRFHLLHGERYVVTGAPVVLDALSTSITHSILVLLAVALVVMALTLALVFRTRLRLLPLGVALAATGLTFGGMRLVGASLTMASIAVLPVMIGLAVDYAIQFQSRFDEQRRAGGLAPAAAARRAAALGGPTIATAGAATAAGFLVLLLSPVPMVRGFGVLLVIGIALAFACALTAGFAAMVLGAERGRQYAVPVPARRAATTLGEAWRGAGELLLAAGLGAHDILVGDPRQGVEPETGLLRRRGFAYAIDLLVLAGLVRLLAGRGLSTVEVVAGSVLVALALVVLQRLTGLTPGKLLLGVRAVGDDGAPPGLRAGRAGTRIVRDARELEERVSA